MAPGEQVIELARVRSKFSPDRDLVSCAGQGCNDRLRCLRYRRHAAWVDQKWASFDLERQAIEGPCPGFDRV
jgi:hypothetical protein